jgi:hypothetical protein
MTEPLSFKEQWEAKKLLKKAKKKARNNAMKTQGMTKKEATGAVKRALNRIASNKPATRAAGRGG